MGVQEEALYEEMLYLIGHLAHAEQHLIEIDSALKHPLNTASIDALRTARKLVGKVLFELIKAQVESGGGEFRTSSESFWCSIKHLAMAMIHCDECIEKMARRFVKNPSVENLNGLKTLLETRDTIRNKLKEVIEMSGTANLEGVEAIRCREDLCLEEES